MVGFTSYIRKLTLLVILFLSVHYRHLQGKSDSILFMELPLHSE